MKKFKMILVTCIAVFMTFMNAFSVNAQGTLKILLSEEPTEENALNLVLQEWAEETGNTVEKIVIPYDDQLTKFPLMLRNNDVPDLVATTRLTRLYPEEFVDLSSEIDTSIFDSAALEIVGQDYTSDKKLALPNQYTLTTYFINVDAFKKAGIEIPSADQPWTFDELYENAKILMEKGDVKYGFAVDFSRARYDNLMYSNGGSITIKDGETFKVAVNSPENINTLQTFVDKNNEGVLPNVIWSGGSSDNPADYFKNGDVGIYLSGTWNYSPIYEEVDSFEFGIMPSPTGSNSQSVIAGGSGLAVPTGSENKELALDFMKWLFLNEENYKRYLEYDKGISFITGIVYEPQDSKVAEDYQLLAGELKNVTDIYLTDETSGWRNYLDNEYRDAIKKAVSGELTAEEALTEFAEGLAEKSGWEKAY